MSTQSPEPISTQTDESESKMRHNFGIDGTSSPASSSNDPLKAARQAIRSQVTAREYAERQLAEAQGAIQDLRGRLRHVHQEREAAIAAAQSAMVAKDVAERAMRAAESVLATERSNRARTEGLLRDAHATILDLRQKLATANQTLRGVQAELAGERQARLEADSGLIAAPEIVAVPIRDAVAPIARRPVGTPRKIGVITPVLVPIRPSTANQAWPEVGAGPNRNVAARTARRPVGRPRKTATVQPVEEPTNPPKKAPRLGKSATRIVTSRSNDQEPVQWWVEGWKGR